MIERNSAHAVPDPEVVVEMTEIPEEAFYSEVLSVPRMHAQLMETSDSDCSSEAGSSKIYMPLVSDRKYVQMPCSPISERLLSADRINLYSWKTRHPKNWQPQDITNWIYYVCSKDNRMDRYKIKAENFNRLQGDDLCTMSLEDFVRLEPNYGGDLFYCLQSLLGPAHYKAPMENIEMTQFEEVGNANGLCPPPMWSSAMLADEDQDMDLTPCGPLRSLDLESVNPGSGVAVIGDKQYDYISDDGFDDIPRLCAAGESGYGSDDSGRSSPPGASVPPPAHMNYPRYMIGQPSAHTYPHAAHPAMCQTPMSPLPANMQTTPEQACHNHQAAAPAPKPRGRPKREGHVPMQRGRKPGTSTKGNHLWKFIRDTINNCRYNPDVIRWEDQEEGIFRIVNSGEMARLWGEKKNNKTMTYEKFSRAMRYCRKQGDFGPLPKDRNLPKKLCFCFGNRKWTEDYYKSNILRRVGSRKLVYAFGSKVFPHLVLLPEHMRPGMMVPPYPCYG